MPRAGSWQGLGADVQTDRITVAILLAFTRSEHSAQLEMLDMQEAAGSSPAPPTSHEFVLNGPIDRVFRGISAAQRFLTA